MAITSGTVADCAQACDLIAGVDADYVMADKGYDSDELVKYIEENHMVAVIPPRKNRKMQREYDKYLYRLRHLVENAFMELKKWRGIATRYAKNTSSYLAAVHIRCMAIWAKVNCG